MQSATNPRAFGDCWTIDALSSTSGARGRTLLTAAQQMERLGALPPRTVTTATRGRRVIQHFATTVKFKKRLLRLFGLDDPRHAYVIRAHRLRRRLLRVDERLQTAYLRKATQPKLQVGGGWHRLEGWLNTDIEMIPSVMQMDATKHFPFGDGTFEFVYSEHMPLSCCASATESCGREVLFV
jgi:hypothetical protein